MGLLGEDYWRERRESIGKKLKTKQQFLALEKICADWQDKFVYPKNGYKPERVTGPRNQDFDLYLVRIAETDNKRKVEEKSESAISVNFPFEIWQDYKLGSEFNGWPYKTKAQIVIYTFWSYGLPAPDVVYQIRWPSAFEWLKENYENYSEYVADGGWGHTVGRLIPWKVLQRQDLCKVLYRIPLDLIL